MNPMPADTPRPPLGNLNQLVDRVLAVPKSTIDKRIEQHRREAAKNPNRPGPKPKVKTSASGARVRGDL